MMTLTPIQTWTLTLFVPGDPRPQGSKTPVRYNNGRLGVRESDRDLNHWRAIVRLATQEAMLGGRLIAHTGPVALELEFVRPRNSTAPKTYTPDCTVAPDLDKMIRAVYDSLTNVAYIDDKQVTRTAASKRYAEPGEPAGVHITVDALPRAHR